MRPLRSLLGAYGRNGGSELRVEPAFVASEIHEGRMSVRVAFTKKAGAPAEAGTPTLLGESTGEPHEALPPQQARSVIARRRRWPLRTPADRANRPGSGRPS